MNWILAEMGADIWMVETMQPVRRTDEDRVSNKKTHTRSGVNTLLYTHISLPRNDNVNICGTLHFTFQEITLRLSYPITELIPTYLYVGQTKIE